MVDRHRPVDDWDPVEVVKAVHAYQHATADSPGWTGSAAHRLTTAIDHAAAQRLPGYADAKQWKRAASPGRPLLVELPTAAAWLEQKLHPAAGEERAPSAR